MSPGIKRVVVMGDARATDGQRPVSVSANDALVPLVMILASPHDVEGSLRELALRIESLLGSSHAPSPHLPRNVLKASELVIDQDAQRATVDGEEILLTGLEFKLLVALAERRDRVYPRKALLAEVWESNVLNRTRTVDTHVKRLRDKLKSAGRFIQTVRGVGYRFSETLSARSDQMAGPKFARPNNPCLPLLRSAQSRSFA